MAAVTPGVAFDLSVNLESRAFIGSIFEAEVSSRLDFTLEDKRNQKIRTRLKREKFKKRQQEEEAEQSRKQVICVPVLVVLKAFAGVVGWRQGEHGVVAGPEPQRGGLSWAGVGAELGGELVGHGGS